MPPGLTLDQLRNAVSQNRIDTVLLALTDMQGERLVASHFLDEVVAHAAEACNHPPAVDVEMKPHVPKALAAARVRSFERL